MIEDLTSFPAVYAENWADWWPHIYKAIGVTTELKIWSFGLAILRGLLLAVGKLSHSRIVRGVCTVYIEAVRGVPALTIRKWCSSWGGDA